MSALPTFRPLLAVMNPRRIPVCLDSIAALDISRVWLKNMSEWDLVPRIAAIVADDAGPVDFTHLMLVSDDCEVSQDALGAVLELGAFHRVATGYCKLDATHDLVNITDKPITGDVPRVDAYSFRTWQAAHTWPSETIPTGFVGMALTCMSRDMWRSFPFGVFGNERRSYASDFHLSRRLRDAGVPMWAARDGEVLHHKTVWNETADHPLLIGQEPAAVVWE